MLRLRPEGAHFARECVKSSVPGTGSGKARHTGRALGEVNEAGSRDSLRYMELQQGDGQQDSHSRGELSEPVEGWKLRTPLIHARDNSIHTSLQNICALAPCSRSSDRGERSPCIPYINSLTAGANIRGILVGLFDFFRLTTRCILKTPTTNNPAGPKPRVLMLPSSGKFIWIHVHLTS